LVQDFETRAAEDFFALEEFTLISLSQRTRFSKRRLCRLHEDEWFQVLERKV